jgi:hypothetical protein
MSEKHVIDQEFLTQINQLRETSTELIYELGQIEMELIATEQRLEDLHKAKAAAVSEYKQLQVNETELVKQLSDKYGTGTLNIESGEFVES